MAKNLMSGAVDGELSEIEHYYFDQHIESCERCRNEFELEKLTQAYFKGRVGLLEPPDDLLESIRISLSREDALRTNREKIHRPSFRRYLQPALGIAMVVVLIIVAVLTRKPDRATFESSGQLQTTSPPQSTDALIFSDSDFQNLLKGEFRAQITAHDADDIIEFIKQKAGFSIPIPVIHNADWIGGNVTTLENEKIITVAYKVGPSYIYIYAFPTELAHSKTISLSLGCINSLDKNAWFWSQSSKGDLQVAWKYKNHVCVATSNLNKNNLIAYLKTSKGINENDWQ